LKRLVLLAVSLVALPWAGTLAQSSPTAAPTVTVSPSTGDFSAPHHVVLQNLPPNSTALAVLFDPGGGQTVMSPQVDAGGTAALDLEPPAGRWLPGVYRVVLATRGNGAVSGRFTAGDGQPHLLAEPFLPSPTSVFNFIGTGLPANASFDLVLLLTGGQQGAHVISAASDASGTFSAFVWPQEFGLPFFAAGAYRVSIPSLGLSTDFLVREHPVSSTVWVDGPARPGGNVPIHLRYYAPGRYLWGIYQRQQGQPIGQFLVGPTDARGAMDTGFTVPAQLPGGQYWLATPYDWGETSFTVPDATPTPTPTATRTPTPTPTPKSIAHHRRTACKRFPNHVRRCRR
jgi:hypothetical protein